MTITITTSDGHDRQVQLDFRYFGVTDDTVSKLRARSLDPAE